MMAVKIPADTGGEFIFDGEQPIPATIYAYSTPGGCQYAHVGGVQPDGPHQLDGLYRLVAGRYVYEPANA